MNENNQYPYNGSPFPPPQIPLKICPKCKAQIGKTLEVCPYCGKKQKTKIGCLGAIGIFFLVCICLSVLTSCMNALTGRNRKTEEQTTPTTAITETTAPETTVTETEPPTTEPPTTEITETETEPETEPVTEPETTEATVNPRDAVNNGDYSLVTPEFKATMDAYEAFYDEYIAFMKNYTSGEGDMMSMLNDYMSMMSRMEEWTEKMDAIDESTLTPADDAYYLLVTARVSAKLLGTAYSMG